MCKPLPVHVMFGSGIPDPVVSRSHKFICSAQSPLKEEVCLLVFTIGHCGALVCEGWAIFFLSPQAANAKVDFIAPPRKGHLVSCFCLPACIALVNQGEKELSAFLFRGVFVLFLRCALYHVFFVALPGWLLFRMTGSIVATRLSLRCVYFFRSIHM